MSTETASAAEQVAVPPPAGWEEARSRVYAVGLAAALPAVSRPLADADGHTLAEPLATRTDLPAFPTSSVDGWAVRGGGPWRIVGRVLAGGNPSPLAEDGTTVEIATGAMVPEGVTAILRIEESTRAADGRVAGTPDRALSGAGRARRRTRGGTAPRRRPGRPGGDRSGRLLRARRPAGAPPAPRRAAGLR